MNSQRRFLLIALIVALLAGVSVGWMWGDDMKAAIDAQRALRDARQYYRKAVYNEGVSALTKELKNAEAALRTLQAGPSPHPDDIKAAQGRVRAGRRRLEAAPQKIKGLKKASDRAKEAFNTDSNWYLFYRLTAFFSKLFLNLLNLLVIPLVITSLVMGMNSLGDLRHVGKTGLRTIIYYMLTTAIAVIIGITLVQIIHPGSGIEDSSTIAINIHGKEDTGILDTVLRVLVDPTNNAKGAFPANIFKAMSEMNVLGVIVFTLFFAGALTMIGEKAKPVIKLFDALNETILKMIHIVLYLMPPAVFALIVVRLAQTGGADALRGELSRLSLYVVTVLGGLAIHAVVILPLILWLFTGRNPLRYAGGMAQALFTAFSTASSSATMPTTLECALENNKISKKSANFVIPIGATINMDGTALYEAVAVIFIAQIYNIPMDLTILIVVFLTATLAAVGAAGIPEAGLVTMVIVLNATGLPLEGIAILLSIDWFLDRCRTTVNVWGDSVGAAVIDRFEEQDKSSV